MSRLCRNRCFYQPPGSPATGRPRTVGLAQSTVSAYMAELERAGLVKATLVGKWTHYKRDEQRIGELIALLGQTL